MSTHWVIQVLKWVSMSPWAGDVWLHCSLAACFTCPVLLCSVCVPDLRVPLRPGRHWCDWPHLPPGPLLLQGPGVPACWQARVSHPLAGISAKEAGEKCLSLFLYSTYLRVSCLLTGLLRPGDGLKMGINREFMFCKFQFWVTRWCYQCFSFFLQSWEVKCKKILTVPWSQHSEKCILKKGKRICNGFMLATAPYILALLWGWNTFYYCSSAKSFSFKNFVVQIKRWKGL